MLKTFHNGANLPREKMESTIYCKLPEARSGHLTLITGPEMALVLVGSGNRLELWVCYLKTRWSDPRYI